MDRFDLYELTVQSPTRLVPFLQAIHGREPRVLGEDFSGTAAVSRAWVTSVEGGRAIAVDRDAEALSRARDCVGLSAILADVRAPSVMSSVMSSVTSTITGSVAGTVTGTGTDTGTDTGTGTGTGTDTGTGVRTGKGTNTEIHPADVIFVGNFSIGELHTRRELVEYLRHARSRLNPHGVFVCDTYGGESAFRIGAVERIHPMLDGARIRYTWEQRSADPLTGEVVNALHFRVERDGDIVQEITDAFVYRWRLWSVPELRDALEEAGFARIEVYDELPDQAVGGTLQPLRSLDARSLGESFILCVIGRT